MGFHLGKRLIAYIKAWSFVLNEKAVKHGLLAFDLNTYIISILVIFYLQSNHGLPPATELDSKTATTTKFSSKNKLGEHVTEFFEFYGNEFALKSHLVSINVGKWQQKSQAKERFVARVLWEY